MIANYHLIVDIKSIIYAARQQAYHSVNWERTLMYWNIGKRIFEEEQQGKERADYGTFLIKELSALLQPEFGSGFSTRNWS